MGLLGGGAGGRIYRRLRKAVYGLNAAPRQWYLKLSKCLRTIGFARSVVDPCVWILTRNCKVVSIVLLYVDDLLLAAGPETLSEIERELCHAFLSSHSQTLEAVQKKCSRRVDVSLERC